MIGTIISFSVMAVAGRELASTLDTFEIMLYRSAFGCVIVGLVLTWARRWRDIRTQKLGIHALRNLSHFAGQNLWFYAVGVIPLAQVFALEFTTPLWVILFATLLLKERLTGIRVLCGVLGFIGVLMILRPGQTELSPGVITAMSAAVFFALSIILTKKLTATDSIACIMFYLTSMQLVFGLIAAGWDGDITLPGRGDIAFVLAIAIAGLVAHFCYTKALSLAPASVVSPVDFARLPTIVVLGWLLYSEPMDPWIILGAVIIFAGNYLNILTETRRA